MIKMWCGSINVNTNNIQKTFSVFRGYISRKKIVPMLRRLPMERMSLMPFPPMSAKVKSKFELVGGYLDELNNKQGYRLHDFSVYAGDWANFLMHGLGKRITIDGEVYEGEFRYHE